MIKINCPSCGYRGYMKVTKIKKSANNKFNGYYCDNQVICPSCKSVWGVSPFLDEDEIDEVKIIQGDGR